MIKILKEIRKEQGLYLLVTELDAAAADITTDCQRECVDGNIMNHLDAISKNIDSDTVTRKFRDYLVEHVFNHYVDMVSVLDYIYVVRKSISVAIDHPNHGKFIFMTVFKNYVSSEDQEPKCEDNDCDGDGDGCDKGKDEDEE